MLYLPHAVQADTIYNGPGSQDYSYLVPGLYYLINGAPSTGYPAGMGGPSDGFIGMIRQITGPTALGGGLSASGYKTCSSIPATGSASMTEAEGTFTMTFSTPVKVIPTGYTGANGSAKFDKRVEVAFNGTDFMIIEFNCDSTVGWLRFADNQEISGGSTANARHMEMFYDTTTASAVKLELAMYYEPTNGNNEYFRAFFETSSTTDFKYWITRVGSDDGGSSYTGFRIALSGSTSSNNANVFMHIGNEANSITTQNTDGALTTGNGDISCMDISDALSIVEDAGACGSLAITSVPTFNIDTDGNMSMSDVYTNVKPSMTAL